MIKFGMRKTFDRLNHMIDSAMNGTYEEGKYNESELSKLEVKWKNFITSSVLAKKKVEDERQNIKEFVTDISHQTKTPLANIMLYTQLLEEQELNEQSFEMVKEIQKQSEKLSFLIQSLVKISRLESGTFQLNPIIGRTDRMLRRLVEQVYGKAKTKNISLQVKMSNVENLDFMNETNKNNQSFDAVFDEKWTLEALGNILDNAIKYSPENSIITLGMQKYEMFLCISIEDEGIGIPEEERAKVFGRFYRGRNVMGEEGIGIGLYLARQIVSAQGGYIKISPGKTKTKEYPGTIFQIYLPTK